MSMSQNASSTPAANPSTTGPSASDPTTAAAAVSTNITAAEEATSSSTVSSLADLKQKSPKIYKFMMLSLAQNMCIQMNRDNDNLIQLMKQMGGDDS